MMRDIITNYSKLIHYFFMKSQISAVLFWKLFSFHILTILIGLTGVIIPFTCIVSHLLESVIRKHITYPEFAIIYTIYAVSCFPLGASKASKSILSIVSLLAVNRWMYFNPKADNAKPTSSLNPIFTSQIWSSEASTGPISFKERSWVLVLILPIFIWLEGNLGVAKPNKRTLKYWYFNGYMVETSDYRVPSSV